MPLFRNNENINTFLLKQNCFICAVMIILSDVASGDLCTDASLLRDMTLVSCASKTVNLMEQFYRFAALDAIISVSCRYVKSRMWHNSY